jgi:DsbC/DsbD-like thiol-disulfide interchange protein
MRILLVMRFICLLVPLFFHSFLRAEEPKNPLKIRLISEMQTVAAGQTFYVGMHLNHPAGYHTYWKHPGAVGVATSIKWDLPTGVKAGEIEWPAPETAKMANYTAQGYHGETLLMIPITLPEKLTSQNITLHAKASWMCCADGCYPATDVPFSITLPLASEEKVDSAAHLLFEKFRAIVPKPDPKWQAAVRKEKDTIILTLQKPNEIGEISNMDKIRFFTTDGQVDSDAKQQVEILPSGEIQLKLPISEMASKNSTSLPGVVTFRGDMFLNVEIAPKY